MRVQPALAELSFFTPRFGGKNEKKKTKKIVAQCLPLLAGMAVLLQYFLAPNYGNNQITMVYPAFTAILIAGILILFLISFWSDSVNSFLTGKSAWFTAIFLVFFALDFVTLKKGCFTLPMFPWPDRLLNEIIKDKLVLLDCAKNFLKLLFTGYFYGMVAGLVTSVLAGRSRKARYWIAPVLKLLGPIPAVTWMALFFVLSKTLFIGCVVMVSYSVWHPVANSTMNAIMQVDHSYGEVAQTLGAKTECQLVLHVTIPIIMPGIFHGLMSGMKTACGSLVIAEMMGVESGLAWYMTWQRGWGNFTKMYTAVVVICVVFILVDLVLSLIKKRVLRWQEVQK